MEIQELDNVYRRIMKAVFEQKNIGGYLDFAYRGARVITYGLKLNDPLQLDTITKIGDNVALACRSKNVLSMRENGHVVYQIQLPDYHWKQYYRGTDVNGLEVGLTDDRTPIRYEFDPPHSLVAGTTGAGKTFATISMLLGLCEEYTPDELGIVICDPHGDLDEFENEEHILTFEWGSIASTYDEIGKAIDYVHNEMLERIRTKNKSAKKIVLVVDESESIVESNKKALKQLVDIGNQARKFEIYMLITAKKPTQATLPKLLNTLSNKWIGQMSLEKASVTRLVGHSIDINKLSGTGDFFHIDNNSADRFLVATIRDNDYSKLKRGGQSPLFINKGSDVELPKLSGRPSKIEMSPLAYYWLHGPDNVMYDEAEDLFGFTPYYHKKYCDLIREFGKCYIQWRKLRRK